MQIIPSAGMVLILLAMTVLISEPNSPIYARFASLGVGSAVGMGTVAYAFRQRERESCFQQPLRRYLMFRKGLRTG